ncbi:MAG: pyruvate ferredoxin oxidoreductase [Firmicutes bacterium]|jgi:pyruvate ferredoxin oxidoreductase beta subunit|nr:pyruvate ferredoxin oxidoreductase [Bacillota bacterium]
MANLKQLAAKEDLLTGGHRACAGCAAPIIVRQVLLAAEHPVVVGSATGCLEVTTTLFPYTAWKVPFIHNAFENSAATVSGVEAAYQSLKRQGKYDKEVRFIAFGGDGGTYDIGLQSLSGAMERGHQMLYICYDNHAYMNTGIQRSSATPLGAHTTTSPAGKVIPGKKQYRKDLTAIMVAHNIPYVAQTSVSHWRDLVTKVKKALDTPGPTFINVLSPCRLGWGFKPEDTIELAREAVENCFWPLYEVENGVYKLTYKPKEKKPVVDWLKKQTRFRHLFKPGNEELLAKVQEYIDTEWEKLLQKCGVE